MKLQADLVQKLSSVESGIWSLKEHWSILIPFVIFSACCHLGRKMEQVGFTASQFSGESSILEMSIRGSKIILDPPACLKKGDRCQIPNRFQIGKAPEVNKMYFC